jgi:hypothetical protein
MTCDSSIQFFVHPDGLKVSGHGLARQNYCVAVRGVCELPRRLHDAVGSAADAD